METAELRLSIGQIAANEAQHAGAIATLRGRRSDRQGIRTLPSDRRCLGCARPVRELTDAKEVYSASEASAALGISLDTLRRWDKAGRIRSSEMRATAGSSPLRRSTDCAVTARERTSARAIGSTAIVTDVKTDGLMAQVEMVVSDPVRLVAIVTRDAVDELGLKEGMTATAIVKSTNVIIQC